MTMRQIVGIIVKMQASGGEWLISEAIVDTVRVYIYLYGYEVDEVLKVGLYQMVGDQDGLAEARQLRRNLEDTHIKMRENVKIKIANYLDPLLEVPSSDKLYVNELTGVRKLHKIDTVDTRTIINEMMPKSYDYIVAAESAEPPTKHHLL